MTDYIDTFIDEERYIVWFRINGEWVSRPINQRFKYLTKLEKCPKARARPDYHRSQLVALLVIYFGRIDAVLTEMGVAPKQRAGSKHKLGYYKQGVN